MYDVAIVGLGPAGATLARLLDSSLSVAAIDRKSSEGNSFRKPCGGLLAPDAQRSLSRFDLALPKEVLVDPQIFAVRTLDIRSRITRHYQRFYMNIDRHKFDRWLQSLVPRTVDVYDGSVCTRVDHDKNGFEVEFSRGGKTQTIHARHLVGADGANSIVRRLIYPMKQIRTYVAIQQWFAERNPSPFYSCIFDSEATDCYSWSISKDGFFIFGGAYPRDGCRERFESQKNRLEALGFRFGDALKTEGCLVHWPSGPGDFCTGKDGAFLVGEAAGFISPSSLEGISGALDSAFYLSQALNDRLADPCRTYRRKTARLRLKMCLKLAKSPFLYYPPARRIIMRLGIGSIDVVKR